MENARSALFDLVDSLLAPGPGEDPAGPSVRYDPVMAEIRVAREADDPSLPQGEWERPLKKADWPLVVKLCSQVLSERSKDLQVAAWLTEAWIHLHQMEGFRAGTRLVSGLLQTYWEGVHPRQDEDGDFDARVASLAWMNESLPLTLRLNVGLLPWPDRKPAFINLEDWTKAALVTPPNSESDDSESHAANSPSRHEMTLVGSSTGAPLLLQLRESLAQAMAEWKALDTLIDSRLGNGAPSLTRVLDTLGLIDRALISLLSKRNDKSVLSTQAPPEKAVNIQPSDGAGIEPIQADADDSQQLEPSEMHTAIGPIRSRADAYRQLEEIADFLQSTEPHSPTPYLIRRAVVWGSMPLPQLMQQLLREEGDLNRLFTVLRLNPEST